MIKTDAIKSSCESTPAETGMKSSRNSDKALSNSSEMMQSYRVRQIMKERKRKVINERNIITRRSDLKN